jgi:Bacterial SH3 domain
VTSLVRTLLVVALLTMPLLVVTELPKFLDLAASVPPPKSSVTFATAEPAFRLIESTPTATRARFGALDPTPPPTLSPPSVTATAVPTARPQPTGEHIVIGNTGGIGAVLRSDPVTGRPVAALREQQVLDVIERRNVPGGGDWVHVRTADGTEGWVTGIVARPAPPGT